MSEFLGWELQLLIHSLYMGLAWGGLYIGLAIIRHGFKKKFWISAFLDIVFWLFCIISGIWLIYRESNGILRGFSLIAMSMGMLISYIISQKLLKKVQKVLKKKRKSYTIKHYTRDEKLRLGGRHS